MIIFIYRFLFWGGFFSVLPEQMSDEELWKINKIPTSVELTKDMNTTWLMNNKNEIADLAVTV